ncbi:hypothetical protein CLV51_11036 [Chitinophaga niastensis]|uniref:TerB family tellurite resistance protein n=1 Tax=Chitinophaga niastensis TaxID=536980 RepID=A0A2P8H9F8_CHINA|nr:hypothetical protein [Chitinophaga niastensis]PSL42820.1 hypothetical protein CLV51_11036 [Chitinophaga niastensis]
MKKYSCFIIVCILTFTLPKFAKAQADELAQLALNIEKLNQFRQILSDMKKGYEVISKGYNTVKSLTEGNFNIHQTFLDGLMAVSPGVKKYRRVADIILLQKQLISSYKSAFSASKSAHVFNDNELSAMGKVYGNLFNRSLKNLDELLMVITANTLRMSDGERLQAIDRIYLDMKDKVEFLRVYNVNNYMLSIQKQKKASSIQDISDLYGIQKENL